MLVCNFKPDMDTEKSSEVFDVSDTPQQEELVMEKEEVSKLESTEPENPPAADEAAEQPAWTGQDTEETKLPETEELVMSGMVMMSDVMGEIKLEDSFPEDSDSVPELVGISDESSENSPGPVGALDTEPEQIQPVPENNPEPLPVQIAPVPEPDELPKSVAEAEPVEQTLHEPATLQQLADKQQPEQEEKVEAEAEMKSAMDTAAEAVEDRVAESGDVAKPTNEVKEEAAVKVTETEVSPEKPTEDIENVKPAEDEAKVEQPADSDAPKEAEPVVEAVIPEQNDAEPEKEEDPAPASGSLSFALLEQEQTRDALRASRTLVVLRGLPGSGKSFLARAILDAYKDHCSVICADDYNNKTEGPDSCADGYKALDEAVVARCSAPSVLLVVDDTNHTQDRLARFGEIAEEQHLVVVFLEPRTEWSRDLSQLTKKTKRGLEEAQIKAMSVELEEMSFPLFFGWFLLSSVQEKVRCTSMDFLKTLDTLEAFKKHSTDFAGKDEKDVDLEQYFQAKGTLHCTTKFCDYGRAEGAKEYAQNQAVKDLYGSAFELSLSALFVTPRTVGAQVSLTEEQLVLWPADAEKEAESAVPGAASLPLGSRAHVTLGCAEGVEPVQTGLDLLEILTLKQGGQQGELVEEMELGTLTYYAEGRWLLTLREPICATACFSSLYCRKEPEPTKKEPEKKKKPRCAIL